MIEYFKIHNSLSFLYSQHNYQFSPKIDSRTLLKRVQIFQTYIFDCATDLDVEAEQMWRTPWTDVPYLLLPQSWEGRRQGSEVLRLMNESPCIEVDETSEWISLCWGWWDFWMNLLVLGLMNIEISGWISLCWVLRFLDESPCVGLLDKNLGSWPGSDKSLKFQLFHMRT